MVEDRLLSAESSAGPAARIHIQEARKQLESAKQACLASAENLEQAVKDKNEAVARAEYWKQKQQKALKELWLWRGAFIVAGLFALKGPIFWVLRKFMGIPW
jgi:hypothetical protein